MSEFITPAEIDRRLRDLEALVDDAYRDLWRAEVGYQEAKATYEIGLAEATMTSEGSNEWTRRKDAEHRCAHLRRDLAKAEAAQRAARANVERIRTHVDITQSRGANLRAALTLN